MTEVTRAASDGSRAANGGTRAANGGPAAPEGGPRGSLSTDDAPVTPGGGPLTERHGCAKRPGRPVARRRPTFTVPPAGCSSPGPGYQK